jgi:hemolysin III
MTSITEVSRFSNDEEMANALSHFSGALLSIAAVVLLILQSLRYGDVMHIVSSTIFGSTMIILYLSSGMAHYLKQGKLKNLFFSLDKIAIYLLIAGTYTPLSLITLQGGFGWTIFGIEWACALIGTIIILFNPVIFEKGVNTLTVIIYAAMGWLIIIAIVPLIQGLPTMGWTLIFLGGLTYTVGIFFYKKGNFKYHHLVWHLCVMLGTLAHFFAIYLYVIPG